jgi:hypothetical protein
VSVYSYDGRANEIPVPVMKWDGNGPNDTSGKYVESGTVVQVFLRNNYKDDMVILYPQITLCILCATVLLDFALGRLLHASSKEKPAEIS